jgi:hypothetical protein
MKVGDVLYFLTVFSECKLLCFNFLSWFYFSENEPIKDEEHKIIEMQHRWSGLAALLQERKEQIDFLKEKELFYSEIRSLELILEGYQKWFEGTKCSSPRQLNVVQQLEHCRMKIKTMKSHEDSINKIKKWATDLSLCQVAKSDADSINADVNCFLERWGELMLRCVLLLDFSFIL